MSNVINVDTEFLERKRSSITSKISKAQEDITNLDNTVAKMDGLLSSDFYEVTFVPNYEKITFMINTYFENLKQVLDLIEEYIKQYTSLPNNKILIKYK